MACSRHGHVKLRLVHLCEGPDGCRDDDAIDGLALGRVRSDTYALVEVDGLPTVVRIIADLFAT